MFNAVRLTEEDARLQLFLWRESEEVEQDMYIRVEPQNKSFSDPTDHYICFVCYPNEAKYANR